MSVTKFIDARFLQWDDVTPNQRYSKIINYDITRSPIENNSYQSKYVTESGKRWDRFAFFLKKRRWLKQSKFLQKAPWTINAIEFDMSDHFVSDEIFLDWERYLMVIKNDYSEMRVFRQLWVNEIDACTNTFSEDFSEWYFINISKYATPTQTTWPWQLIVDYFPFNKCLRSKFVVANWPKWASKKSWEKGIITNQLIWAEIITSFIDSDESFSTIEWWDYLTIYDWSFSTQTVWVSANNYSSNDIVNWLLLDAPFWWFSNVSVPNRSISTDSEGNVTEVLSWFSEETSEKSSPHKWKVFPDYGAILWFVTSDGIMMLNNPWPDSEWTEFTYEGNTHYYSILNKRQRQFTITALAQRWDSLVYIDGNQSILYHWLVWTQKAYFDPRNSTELDNDFDEIAVISWYLILIWRSRIRLINPLFLSLSQITFTYKLDIDNVWYFNKGSWAGSWGLLRIMCSDWFYRKIWVQTFSENAIVPQVEIDPVFYQSDIDALERDKQFVYISYDGRREYLVLTDMVDTQVLVRDFFWFKWIYEWSYLRHIDDENAWWWDWYTVEWTTDYWSEYKTLVQMNFWEFDYHVLKHLYMVKFSVWSDSSITRGNTLFRFWIDHWGWKHLTTYNELYRSEYISNIMSTKDVFGKTDIIKNLPIGIEIKWGNGITVDDKEFHTFSNDVNNWSNLDMSYTNDTNQYETKISKYWVIEFPINKDFNSVTLEVITNNKDNIVFWWFFVGYDVKDISETRIGDVMTQNDFSNSWMSWYWLT